MIRRLQIEPPKLALPTDKSQTCENPATDESLAAEFKKLLEKARSGISGARDEVVALGMALSQAVSTVRTQQVELKKTESSEGDNSANEVSDDGESGVSGDGNGGWSDVGVTTSRSSTEVSKAVEGEDDNDQKLSTQVELASEEHIDVGEGEGEISLDDEVVYSDISNFVDGTNIVDEGANLSEKLVGVAQNANTTSADSRAVEGEVADKSSGLTRVTLIEDSDDEGGDVDEGTLEVALDQTQANQSINSLSSRRPSKPGAAQSEASEDSSSRDIEMERFLAQAELTSDDSWGEIKSDSFSRPFTVGGDDRGGTEFSRISAPVKGDSSSWLAASGLEGLSQNRDQNRDLSLQLTMLRQAYEGLKAQTLGQPESRAKVTTGVLTGVGASSETKHAQNDAAPRGVRYLNKATAQRMMERIESALKEAARSRDGKTISLKLDPVQLGRVKCDVSLRDGVLHARIVPQNREVLHTVREHSHELQVALRRLGLNVERVTVQVHGDKEGVPFGGQSGLADGKSFQGDGNNMPGWEAQHPEKTIGNDLADVSRATPSDAGITPADHWIA
jgi:flagellar hook-length control protein FliK